MTKFSGTLFSLVLAEASSAQRQFPEMEFGSDPVGERALGAFFVAPMPRRAM
jgi:hypothetical protein